MPANNFDSLIRDVQLAQDVELANSINQLKSNPAQLSTYLQTASDNIYNKITTARQDAFTKSYSDMNRAVDVQKNQYYYTQRNHDLNNLQQGFYKNVEAEANKYVMDNDNAKRQYEINEWASSNKLDTLFIFQILFVCLLVETVVVLFWRRGFFNTGIFSIITVILLVIFTFTVVSRAQYTQKLRNNRYWNKRNFDVYNKKPIPIPDCQAVSDAADAAIDAVSNLPGTATDALNSARQSLGSSLSSLGDSIAGN